jgi:hypothetical protein
MLFWLAIGRNTSPERDGRTFRCASRVKDMKTGPRKCGPVCFFGSRVRLLRGSRYFLLGAAPFFHGRSSIALLQVGENDLQNELLFAVIVELDHDVVFIAGHHASEPKLGMIDLGSLREGGFSGHETGISL